MSILTTMPWSSSSAVPNVPVPRATSEVHGEVLKRMGATVVYPEADMAVRHRPPVLIYGKPAGTTSPLADGVRGAPHRHRRAKLLGRTIPGTGLCAAAYGVNIIAVERGGHTDVEFSADLPLWRGRLHRRRGPRNDKIDRFEQGHAAGIKPPGPIPFAPNPPPAVLPAGRFAWQDACFFTAFCPCNSAKMPVTIKPMIPHGAAGAAAPTYQEGGFGLWNISTRCCRARTARRNSSPSARSCCA